MNFLEYEISHRTIYDYAAMVSLSHHLVCLRPRDSLRQRCLDYSIRVDPEPATLAPHIDYYGNTLHFIALEGAHRRLYVESVARVAVGPNPLPELTESPPWEKVLATVLADRSSKGVDAIEFSYETPLTRSTPEIREYAQISFQPDRPILDAALDLTRRIYEEFKFDSTATDISTPVSEVFANRRGVCQDFAHLQIAALRSLGIPARYISGYIETDPPPGQVKLTGADASHAWVSVYCPGERWFDFDPTNGCVPAMRHITVAHGRDFGELSPLRGVIQGSGEHMLTVGVDVIAKGPLQLPVTIGEASFPTDSIVREE